MPRLSIIGVSILMAATMIAVASQQAEAVVKVRSAQDLANRPGVVKMVQPYMVVSSANVIYDQCADELKLTDEQKAFQKQLFADVSAKYMQAYRDAYQDAVGAPPDTAMGKSFSDAMLARQKIAVNDTALAIKQHGCHRGRITQIMDYINKTREANQGSH